MPARRGQGPNRRPASSNPFRAEPPGIIFGRGSQRPLEHSIYRRHSCPAGALARHGRRNAKELAIDAAVSGSRSGAAARRCGVSGQGRCGTGDAARHFPLSDRADAGRFRHLVAGTRGEPRGRLSRLSRHRGRQCRRLQHRQYPAHSRHRRRSLADDGRARHAEARRHDDAHGRRGDDRRLRLRFSVARRRHRLPAAAGRLSRLHLPRRPQVPGRHGRPSRGRSGLPAGRSAFRSAR